MTLVEQSASRPRARLRASLLASPTASRSDRRWVTMRLAMPQARDSFHWVCMRASSAAWRTKSPGLVVDDPALPAVGVGQCCFHPGRGAGHDEGDELVGALDAGQVE